MTIRQYFDQLKTIVDRCWFMSSYHLEFDERSNDIGYIRGTLHFPNGIELHFREYVDATLSEKYKYAYHVMEHAELLFRYDNSNDTNARGLSTFPHHKHLKDSTVVKAEAKSLGDVLAEIEEVLFND